MGAFISKLKKNMVLYESLIKSTGDCFLKCEGRFSGIIYASTGFILLALSNFFFERIKEINVVYLCTFIGPIILVMNSMTCDTYGERLVSERR